MEQLRSELYFDRHHNLRSRLIRGGPTRSGAVAKPVNPFDLPSRMPIPAKQPYWKLHAESRIRRRLYTLRDDLDVNPMQIIQATCAVAKLTAAELFYIGRGYRLSRPRQVATYFIARYCRDLSLVQIGRMFDQDHTTVMHSITAVPKRIEDGHEETRELVDRVEQLLRAA